MGEEVDEVVEAILLASRAFVAIAAQSVSELLSDLTLPQYRVLVVLSTAGPQTLGSLAQNLGVTPSTASRLCGRLVRKRLISRRTGRDDRREIRLSVTTSGLNLYEEIIRQRRARVRSIVDQLSPETRGQLVTSLRALTAAAGEAPDQAWASGWQEPVTDG